MFSEKHVKLADFFIKGNAELRTALGLGESSCLEAVPLGSGEHNVNFLLLADGRDLKRVLRVNLGTQTGNEHQVAYEASALKALEPSMRVPRVFFVDDTKRRISHGVMVIEFRQGTWLDYGNAAAMEEAARIMADVHAVEPACDCPIKRADDPLQAYFNVCNAFYRNYLASPYADPMVTGYVDEFFAHAKRALETPHDAHDDAHILNTEPLASQFLIPEEKDAGSLIDWEKPVLGEVAQDVAYVLSPTSTIWDTDYVLNAAEREKFVGDYWRAVGGRFSQGRFEERLSAYVKMTCLLAITWSCNAVVEYNDPARELKTERTKRLLPVYLSEEYLANLLDNWFNAPVG